ncbi:hypothetical protein SCYAM73S_03025 [Streptomyces cyaneofuscatus]
MRAAGGAEGLVAHFGPVKAELGRAHQGLTAGAGELSALAELGTVRASWERRIDTARDECRSLAGKLRAVTVTQAEVNEAGSIGLVMRLGCAVRDRGEHGHEDGGGAI